MDKTRVVYHEDEKCKAKCMAKRKAEIRKANGTEDKIAEGNRAIGKKMRGILDQMNEAEKEAQKDMTDREFINNILKDK